jgi:YaeQ protein
MTFIEKFLSFRIQISNSERGVFATIRIKAPKHERDSWEGFVGRLCAFCHAYVPDLELELSPTNGLAFSAKDPTDHILKAGFVGPPSYKLLNRLLKEREPPTLSVYFEDRGQVRLFCNELRGSDSNWIESINFWLLDELCTAELIEHMRQKNEMMVTIVEEQEMYLGLNEWECLFRLERLSMWQEFQRSIGNLPADVK